MMSSSIKTSFSRRQLAHTVLYLMVGAVLGILWNESGRQHAQVVNDNSPSEANGFRDPDRKAACWPRTEETTFETGYRCLLEGKAGEALDLLEPLCLASHVEETTVNPGKAAFYVALCYQALGEKQKTNRWFNEFFRSEFYRDTISHDEFFEFLRDDLSVAQLGNNVHFVSFNQADPKKDRLVETGRKVIEANNLLRKGPPTINTRIRLATWQMLFAEYATANPKFGQHNNASWAFTEGSKTIETLNKELADDPEQLATLLKDEDGQALVMRLDAVRVRTVAIQKRKVLNYDQERARTDALQQIVKKYRDLSAELVSAHTFNLTGDATDADENLKTAMQYIVHLRELSGFAAGKQEFYLFDSAADLKNLDEPMDFEIVNLSGNPFANDLVAQIKAINGLTVLDQVLANQQVGGENLDRLAEAIRLGNAALADNQNVPGLPEGADPESMLALYTVAAANGELARQKVAGDLADPDPRMEVKAGIERAVNLLTQLSQQIAMVEKQAPLLAQKTKKLHFDLSDYKNLLGNSEAAIAKGNVDNSHQLARQALELHNNEPVWVQWLHAVRRSHTIDLDQKITKFEQAIEAKLLDPNSTSTDVLVSHALAEMTLVLRQYANALDQGMDVKALDIQTLSDLRGRATTRAEQLLAGADKSDWAKLQACQTAMTAIINLIDPEAVPKSNRNASFAAGLNAKTELAAMIEKDPGTIVPRECQVALHRGLGLLGKSDLPKDKDDPIAYFMYAHDLEATLPFSTEGRIQVGTPLLRLLQSRAGGEQDKNLAMEERRTRHMIMGFLDASYVGAFGDKHAAQTAADKALDIYKRGQSNRQDGVELDAKLYADIVDGFDSEVTLQDSVGAFRVLAHLDANQPGTAVQHVFTIFDETKQVDPETINVAILMAHVSKTQSPLVAFALARSLEDYALTLGFEKQQYRTGLFKQSLASYQKGVNLLETLRLKEKYGHLSGLLDNGVLRLESPKQLLADLQQGVGVSREELERAVRRHPDNVAIWRIFLDRRLSYARLTEDQDEFKKIITDLRQRGETLPKYVLHLYLAISHENLGDLGAAIKEYKEAALLASNDVEKAVVQAKIGNAQRKLVLGQ